MNPGGTVTTLEGREVTLDEAWKAAEAALPQGWHFLTVGSVYRTYATSSGGPGVVYWASAGPNDSPDSGPMVGGKDSPIQALIELTARLSEGTPS